jgi:pimeloyl-ACP methyl ester carboxylesterase
MDEKIINHHGNRIHYFTSNIIKNRDTIIFVHGLTSYATVWSTSARYFEKRYNVISINLPGHGRTSMSSQPFSKAANDILVVMNKEGIRESHFVGQCIGPYILLSLHSEHPQVIRSLTFTSGNYIDPSKNFFTRELTDAKLPFLLFLKLYSTLEIIHRHAPVPKPKVRDYMTGNLNMLYLKNTLATSPLALYLYYRAMFRLDFSSSLSRIAVPTLILAATKDTVFRPQIARDMARKIPGSTLHILSGDHSFAIKKSEEFNQELESFLDHAF